MSSESLIIEQNRTPSSAILHHTRHFTTTFLSLTRHFTTTLLNLSICPHYINIMCLCPIFLRPSLSPGTHWHHSSVPLSFFSPCPPIRTSARHTHARLCVSSLWYTYQHTRARNVHTRARSHTDTHLVYTKTHDGRQTLFVGTILQARTKTATIVVFLHQKCRQVSANEQDGMLR